MDQAILGILSAMAQESKKPVEESLSVRRQVLGNVLMQNWGQFTPEQRESLWKAAGLSEVPQATGFLQWGTREVPVDRTVFQAQTNPLLPMFSAVRHVQERPGEWGLETLPPELRTFYATAAAGKTLPAQLYEALPHFATAPTPQAGYESWRQVQEFGAIPGEYRLFTREQQKQLADLRIESAKARMALDQATEALRRAQAKAALGHLKVAQDTYKNVTSLQWRAAAQLRHLGLMNDVELAKARLYIEKANTALTQLSDAISRPGDYTSEEINRLASEAKTNFDRAEEMINQAGARAEEFAPALPTPEPAPTPEPIPEPTPAPSVAPPTVPKPPKKELTPLQKRILDIEVR
jgi:hypothetical protein